MDAGAKHPAGTARGARRHGPAACGPASPCHAPLRAAPLQAAALALAALLAGPARADDGDLCLAAAQDAESLSGVPLDVLLAVSLTETGRGGRPWPWTVNLEGEGHWFPTREEATAFAEGALAQGRTSFDVGCFQVNWRWHGENFVSVAQAFDPLANASYAARFLNQMREGRPGWSEAAGAYHSQSPGPAARYREAFDANRARVQRDGVPAGDPGAATLVASTEAPRPNAFPLLRGGGGGARLGSLVNLGG